MLNQSPCEPHTDGVGLTRRPTTSNADTDIELPFHLHRLERMLYALLMGPAWKIIYQSARVDRPITFAGLEHHAGYGGLSSAYRLNIVFRH